MVEHDTDDIAALRRRAAGRHPEVPELPLLGLASTCSAARPRPTSRTTTPPGSRAAGWRTAARTTTSSADDAMMVDAVGRRRRSARPRCRRWSGSTPTCAASTSTTASGGLKRWNRILEQAGLSQRLYAAAASRSTARSARSPASRPRPTARCCPPTSGSAQQGRLAADRGGQDARALADAAGARARQDRRPGSPRRATASTASRSTTTTSTCRSAARPHVACRR